MKIPAHTHTKREEENCPPPPRAPAISSQTHKPEFPSNFSGHRDPLTRLPVKNIANVRPQSENGKTQNASESPLQRPPLQTTKCSIFIFIIIQNVVAKQIFVLKKKKNSLRNFRLICLDASVAKLSHLHRGKKKKKNFPDYIRRRLFGSPPPGALFLCITNEGSGIIFRSVKGAIYFFHAQVNDIFIAGFLVTFI